MFNLEKENSAQGSTNGLKMQRDEDKPFVKKNIIFMVASVAMIVIGFALMAGSGSSVEEGFNPDIFSVRRIVVGPTVAFLGFLAMAFAIVYSPKKGNKGK